MPRGGKRAGAGRKSKLTTIIREKAIREANGDAKYALGLITAWLRDEEQPPKFRRECAEMVMNRVWGKPTQHNTLKADLGARVTFYIPENGRDGSAAAG